MNMNENNNFILIMRFVIESRRRLPAQCLYTNAYYKIFI